jgi:hypothetical protein
MAGSGVHALRVGFGDRIQPPMAVCCNDGCRWTGPMGATVVFKHDKGNANAQHYCPKCNEVVEPMGEDEDL